MREVVLAAAQAALPLVVLLGQPLAAAWLVASQARAVVVRVERDDGLAAWRRLAAAAAQRAQLARAAALAVERRVRVVGLAPL